MIFAAARTMILLDPDLESDLFPRPPTSKPSTGFARTAQLRLERIPSARTLARFLSDARRVVKLRGQVTVLLTTDLAIQRLNRRFRGKNKATDVLSFPATTVGPVKVAGDLAISIPTARRQALEQGHGLSVEVKVLILHGLLHLAGYDHETDSGEMGRREQKLRVRLGLPQGLVERSAARSGKGHP